MTADEHPEDLLDRATQGSLAPEQQAALNRHLAECPVCAAQLSLAPRFERDLAPQPRDQLLYERAVEGALNRMRQSPRGRKGGFPPWFRWAAAAGLLAIAVTGVAAVIGRRTKAPAPTPAPVETHRVTTPIRPVEPTPPEAPPPPEVPPAKTTPSAQASVRPAVTAAELFERGEKLRREGRTDAAIATYRRLQATFPGTAEARLSFAFGGELLLKKGRPADALVQFDRHLSLDGEVGEEALAGRATALEQLHRTSEAAVAWKSLLDRYPRSVYAERARARLDQLNRQP